MDPAEFTFEKFYSIYQAICPRNDIDELFKSMWEILLLKLTTKHYCILFPTKYFSTKTETISMPKFIEFMNEKQRDPRLNEMLFPSYNEKRCTEIINMYEKDEENVKKSKSSNRSIMLDKIHNWFFPRAN